ncbi:MAG: hypothetical protein KBT20_11810 [Bacteroidales bacterium]|nr:hypothetical protein [Candidatus Liminaster caballi]
MKKFFTLAAMGIALAGVMQAQTLADYANAGDAAMNKQNYQEAIDNYLKAQELDVDNTDFMTAFQMASAYSELGEMEKAGDAFKASLLKGNFDQAVITNMKNAYEAAGKPELVKQGYIDIKTANPAQTIAMDRKLYFIYVKEKDNENALKCALSVLEDPNNDEATNIKYYKYAAQLYLNLNQADSAEVYYDKVLAITPDDADVHKALGYGFYNTIQKITANAQATYNAKKSDTKNAQHYYAEMQTATKRATLNYGPKAIQHLKIANQTLNDSQINDIIAKLNNNIAAYKK